MPRRRLRIACLSDDEDEIPDIRANPNPNPVPPDAVEISDEDDGDFVDVSDDLPPPAASSAPASEASAQPHQGSSVGQGSETRSGCPVGDFLVRLGLSLKREWLDAGLNALQSSVPGFASLGVAAKAKLCFERFLTWDMNLCGNGVLPPNVDSMHLVDLPGPYVLQVDEIVNISGPLRGRYEKAPPGIKRCLKLSMTDGVQRVFGMEYRPIQALQVLAPAGLKVAICNVHIRHGLLLLVPEAFEVLGGSIEELEAARQRVVEEINKPPRGKRTRTGVIPPLATRAAHAAWGSNDASAAVHNDSSTLQDATPSQTNNRGGTLGLSDSNTCQRIREESTVPANAKNAASVIMDFEEMHIDPVPLSRGETAPETSSHNVSDVEVIHMVDDVDHPAILSGDQEIPFTYLSSLSAKMMAMKEKSHSVRGKIKCFLTGVKGFQYKNRTTYELRVYVDDGSLIAEILIDHDVVQKLIGHSPDQVTAALSSADQKEVSGMKETLRQFQVLLANFEGTMLIEINKDSSLPVALEMNQGCPGSDAWLLLRRLKSSISSQTSRPSPLDPIVVSP